MEQKDQTQQNPEVKKIIELMKANITKFTFKDMSELHKMTETLYWESYYKALGYDNEKDFHAAKPQDDYWGQWEQSGNGFEPDNKINPRFANIANEAKANAVDDEKAIEEMKKKHLKK